MVELIDDDPDIVARMLIYLYSPLYYTGLAEWDEEPDGTTFPEARRRQALLIPDDKSCVNKTYLDPLAVHAKLHGLSYKYDIPDLTKLSTKRFCETVSHMAVLASEMSIYPEFLEDLMVTIKITYGSEQVSDQTLRDATVYLARAFVKFTLSGIPDDISQAKDNMEALQEVISSISDFAWDMISIHFDSSKFACDYCQSEFEIESGGADQIECVCSQRGLCGNCASVSKLECIDCGWKGGCRSIKKENILMIETRGRAADEMEQASDRE